MANEAKRVQHDPAHLEIAQSIHRSSFFRFPVFIITLLFMVNDSLGPAGIFQRIYPFRERTSFCPPRRVEGRRYKPTFTEAARNFMVSEQNFDRWKRGAQFVSLLLCILAVPSANAQPQSASNAPPGFVVLQLGGTAEFMARGIPPWRPLVVNFVLQPGDHVRVHEESRLLLQLSDHSLARFSQGAEFVIDPPAAPRAPPVVNFFKGLLYLFHRDEPTSISLKHRTMSAAIRGTEFAFEATDDGRSVLTLIDGEVELSNEVNTVTLHSGEQGIAEPGKAPAKTVVIDTLNVIQWCLYYPAILDLDELELAPADQQVLADSLAAYRSGDLLQALAQYPGGRQPPTDPEKIYLAGLLLAVGQVEQAEKQLNEFNEVDGLHGRLARALRALVATVRLQSATFNSQPATLATEWLAESYRQQFLFKLPEALAAARKAVAKSPKFSFGWARVAELEFGFGRTAAARAAVEKSLQLAPHNAEAIALQGFLFAAENRIVSAIQSFDQAIDIDGALGNAWLGRGLCKIRRGQVQAGREDIEVAATLEPQRAMLRSYLSKAWSEAGDLPRAAKEIKLAKELDKNDPTACLYSALVKQQQNSINQAISDLEGSQERNTNRALFRSRFLLDEDRAVGSANLAGIYRDAGMTDVSVREAAKAVAYDYANDSAHLFLADSYNELRDPTRFNLRYETVWFNELLLANLLSPVGGGRLSQHVSQQEYSRLLESDGFHLANSTLARSDNKSVTELASQFGTIGRTSYSLDLDYDYQKGVRPNNDLSSIEWYSTIKQQITPKDTALVLVKYEDYHSGDNFQYYDPTNARPHFRFDEYQHPIAVGAWNHEWSPGMHTLLLGGRLENEQHFSDKAVPQLVLIPGIPTLGVPFDLQYQGELEIYTAELNQLLQWKWLSLSAGARYQSGTFDTTSRLYNPATFTGSFDARTTNAIASSDRFERITGYGYLTVQPLEKIWLTGGLAYDDLTYPRNFRHPPIPADSSGQDHRSEVGPKAAALWEITPQVAVRGAYAKSLGGVSLDESYRLEPTQLAGFPQTFRSLISESVVGSVSAPRYEVYGGALDLKFPSGTYAGVQYQRLHTDVRRTIGVFHPTVGLFLPTSTEEQLNYDENALSVTLNQLLGRELVLGARYQFDQVKFHDLFPGVPVSELATADQRLRADLHEASGYILFNHSSGFFARADANWYHQSNRGYAQPMPGDDFVQENLFVGYRFLRRHAEILLGILNLSNQDYHLNPLTVYQELPRERTFMVRLKFMF